MSRSIEQVEAEWKSAREAVFAAQELANKPGAKKSTDADKAAFAGLVAKRDALKAELAAARKAGV